MPLPNYRKITTDNYYEDVINKIWNALQPLTVPDNPNSGRDPDLSDVPVSNIELNPIVIDSTGSSEDPEIYISMDSSASANDLEGSFGTFIELLNIRLELFVGTVNCPEELTIRSTKLLKDLQYVLTPQTFIGAPLSRNEATLLNLLNDQPLSASIAVSNNLSTHQNEVNLMIELYNGVLLNTNIPAMVQVNGENSHGTSFSEYFFYDESELNITKVSNHKFAQITSVTSDGFSGGDITIRGQIGPQTQQAQIMDAGLLTWGFDERTRGTSKEVLVFIFQLELHHFLPSVTRFTTT